jgi:hypothetical protein
MKRLTWWARGTMALVLLVGCRGGGTLYGIPFTPARSSYHIVVHFASELPDDYYVHNSSPNTYQRYRMNGRFRAEAEAYARRKSAPSGGVPVDVFVTLLDLTTSYDQWGNLDRPGPTEVASAGGVALASFLGGSGGGDRSIPDRILKSAELRVRDEVRIEGKRVAGDEFTVKASQTVEWMQYDNWAYDYSGVFDTLIAKAMVRIDEVLDQALSARGSR